MHEAIELAADKVAQIGPFIINNSLITTWIVMFLLIAFAYLVGKNASKIPGRFQALSEIVLEYLYDLTEGLAGENRTKRFFPVLATFFIFILTANYIGLLPGMGTIGYYTYHGAEKVFVPFFRSANADINVTFALALISVGMTHYYSITTLGIGEYLKRYFSLNPIYLFVGLLEIVSEITKIISLSFRLFGNIFAGEVLLSTISSLLAFIAPLPFMGMELLVGFVQSLVFMMLTMVFMVILTEKHEAH